MTTATEQRFLALPPPILYLNPRTDEWYLARDVPVYDVPEDPALATISDCCE